MSSEESECDTRIKYKLKLLSDEVNGKRRLLKTQERLARLALDLPAYENDQELKEDLKKILQPQAKRVKDHYNKHHRTQVHLVEIEILSVVLGRIADSYSSSDESYMDDSTPLSDSEGEN